MPASTQINNLASSGRHLHSMPAAPKRTPRNLYWDSGGGNRSRTPDACLPPHKTPDSRLPRIASTTHVRHPIIIKYLQLSAASQSSLNSPRDGSYYFPTRSRRLRFLPLPRTILNTNSQGYSPKFNSRPNHNFSKILFVFNAISPVPDKSAAWDVLINFIIIFTRETIILYVHPKA